MKETTCRVDIEVDKPSGSTYLQMWFSKQDPQTFRPIKPYLSSEDVDTSPLLHLPHTMVLDEILDGFVLSENKFKSFKEAFCPGPVLPPKAVGPVRESCSYAINLFE